MSLAALPAELLDAICEPLAPHPAALAALARATTALAPSATRVLYRSLTVSSYARNLAVVRTLATRPTLATLVRFFSLTLADHDPTLAAFYGLLRRALNHMPHLHHLDLLVDSNATWLLSDAQPCYPYLEHLSCSFPLDQNVSAFLVHTPALRSLQLSASTPHQVHSLPSRHIPSLATFTGPASLLPLLASRPLTALHLSGDLTLANIPQHDGASEDTGVLPTRDYTFQRDSFPGEAQVRVLSAVTSAPPAPILAALARAYPALVCLRLMTTCAFWEAPDMSFYKRIAETLASFPDLVAFELSGMHWEQRTKFGASDHASHPPAVREWVSPPVTPRAAEFAAEEEDETEARAFDIGEAFLEWA